MSRTNDFDITLEEFDSLEGNHVFSDKYNERKQKLLSDYKKQLETSKRRKVLSLMKYVPVVAAALVLAFIVSGKSGLVKSNSSQASETPMFAMIEPSYEGVAEEAADADIDLNTVTVLEAMVIPSDEPEDIADVISGGSMIIEANQEKETVKNKETAMADDMKMPQMANPDWLWPTPSIVVSQYYGEQENGSFAGCVCIRGDVGDDVYAVADGEIVTVDYDNHAGHYIVLMLEDGMKIRYEHLDDFLVSINDKVSRGDVIGKLGKTGACTGPCLGIRLTDIDAIINPLME